jgi:serine/threonine protein kinase
MANPSAPGGPEGYRLCELLGRGAFGEVWRAEAPGGIMVAVKILSLALKPDKAQRELDALRSMRELRHPYLLAISAIFAEPERVFVVTELADTSLGKRLAVCQQAGQSGIPPGELLGYMREAAEALDFLHGNNRLHRDIKPDNLLLVAQHLKVADYGLARVLQKQQTTQSESVVGTGPYMAPEMWEGKIGPRSDQYSLAATYAELRCGHPPFEAQNLPQLMYLHLKQPPDLDGIPAAERQVLEKALAKTSAERYPTCMAFVVALIKAFKAGRAENQAPAAVKRVAGIDPCSSQAGGRANSSGWAPRTRTRPPGTTRSPVTRSGSRAPSTSASSR